MATVSHQPDRQPSIFTRIDFLIAPSCSTSTQVVKVKATVPRQSVREPEKVRVKTERCPECEKEYLTAGALKMHQRTHAPPCICKHCGKAFSRPWLLKGHLRTHTGERPYSCAECGRRFADRSNLRAHEHTHRSERRHKCEGCAVTFSRISVLQRHEEQCIEIVRSRMESESINISTADTVHE